MSLCKSNVVFILESIILQKIRLKMKKHIILITLLFLAFGAFSQEIKIKDETIFLDEVACMKVVKNNPNNITITDMEDNELIDLKFIHNTKYASVYNKITFVEQDISFTSKNYVYTVKLLMKKLVADKTVDNCKLNPDKIKRFVQKYDEDVEKKEVIEININHK